MITVYGLSYWTYGYVQQSIVSIKKHASEPIIFNVVDNRSPNSTVIRDICESFLKKNVIQRYIQMDQNVRGNSLRTAYDLYPPDEDIFVFTDLDILVNFDWIKEIRIMMEAGANICGFSLSLENYTFPNRGHSTDGIGSWLMAMNRSSYEALPKDVAYVDSYLRDVIKPCMQNKKELYHLGFSSWRDYPIYWEKHKESPQPWHKLEFANVEFVLENSV